MQALTIVLVAGYALASLLFLGFHVGLGERAARAGRLALAGGFALQLADIAVRCLRLEHPASSAAEAMAFVAWLVAGGYLLASLRYRLAAAGAFAAPAALGLLLLARVVPGEPGAAAPPLGTLGLAHIFLATLGVATFALAAVIEGLYLVQERRLRRRELGRVRGGAPLDTLDRLAAFCVSFGFPVFTLAIITGAIWVARLGILRGGTPRPEHALAVVCWLAFGALLVARAGAGWQGRRAAWLTVGGFSGILLVVFGYLLRAAV